MFILSRRQASPVWLGQNVPEPRARNHGGEPNYRTEPNRRELKYRQRRAGQTKKTQNTDRECCQTERLRQKEIDRVTERESDRVTE